MKVSGISTSFEGLNAIGTMSFAINAVGSCAVISPNAADKTTFMNLVIGKT